MHLSSIPVPPSTAQLLLGLYAYLLPLLLYVLWSTLALWDLGRRPDARPGVVWGWALAVFLLPFVGPAAYLLRGEHALPRPLRLASVGGGVAVYLIVLAVGAGIGGIS